MCQGLTPASEELTKMNIAVESDSDSEYEAVDEEGEREERGEGDVTEMPLD